MSSAERSLETERLVLRRRREEATASLGRIRAQWDEHGFGIRDDFFSTFDFDHLISLAFPGNLASHAVMRKIGMHRVADAVLPSGATVWTHRLDRADWTTA
ncbi:MAG TPA: hypothetical protein VGT60_01275 [Candidatus Limnocylindria bacterium]|nr:hypothetical protein [Candidatus Limnocylindria bacterium]